MDCSNLTKNIIAAICNTKAASGVNSRVLLINYNDVDKTLSEVTDNVITSLVLKATKKAYTFMSFERSIVPTGTLTKGTYMNTWLQSVPLRIFTKDEDSKAFVNSLTAGARLLIIIDNKETGANGEVKYEAHGWDNGLELNEGTYSTDMTDGVVYDLNVGSRDTAQEATLPKSIFDTDLATTELMINGLIAP